VPSLRLTGPGGSRNWSLQPLKHDLTVDNAGTLLERCSPNVRHLEISSMKESSRLSNFSFSKLRTLVLGQIRRQSSRRFPGSRFRASWTYESKVPIVDLVSGTFSARRRIWNDFRLACTFRTLISGLPLHPSFAIWSLRADTAPVLRRSSQTIRSSRLWKWTRTVATSQ